MNIPFDVIGFDLDGTLADTALDLCAALNHALGTLGRPAVDPEGLRHMVGHGARVLIERGLAATGGGTQDEVQRALPAFLDFYARNICVHTRPYPGLEDALAALDAAGIRLAICTNKPEALAIALVDRLGWGGWFRAIVGGDTLPVRKPDAMALTETFARAGGGRAAYVGDSIADTGAARNAGVPCIAVTFGFSDRPPEELGADLLIDDYRDLLPGLSQIGEVMEKTRKPR